MPDRVLAYKQRALAVDWSRILLLAIAAIPAFMIVGLLVMVARMSFQSGIPGQTSPYTLSNYQVLLVDPYNYRVMLTSVAFAAVTLAVSVPLGFVFAWFVERSDLPYKTLATSLLSMGMLIPTFLKAMGWVFLLHPRIGVVNIFLVEVFGFKRSPFNIGTIFGIGFVQGLTLTPVAFLMISAALRNMNPALTEAAGVHGVGRLKTLLRIELPVIWPALLAVIIWIFTIAMATFDVPAVIGMANNIFTISTALYFMINPLEGLPKYGLSGAYGTIMIGLSFLLMAPYFSALKRSHRYQIISGKGYQAKVIELGRWRVAGWTLLGLYILLAFIMPLLALVWVSVLPYVQVPSWQALTSLSFERYTVLLGDVGLMRAAVNTLVLMFIVPTLILIVSTAISWIVTRSDIKGRFILDAVAFLPHLVPNLLFALAIAYLALLISNVIPLYGTIYVLMAVYVVCWISFGTRVLNGSMIQVHKELEEAARVGGVRTFRILRKIILPIIRPGVVYAWIWTSMLAYRELTAAVLLASPKNQVISTFIWGEWATGGMGEAASAGVLMMVIMLPLIVGFWIFAGRQHMASSAVS